MNERVSPPAQIAPREEAQMPRLSRTPQRWRWRLNFALFFLLLTAVIALARLADWPRGSNVQAQAGEISQIDLRAPYPLTYTSDILTEEARQRAANNVARIYDPPQTRVARQQLTRVELILDFITRVRIDPYASDAQKTQWLASISDVRLEERVAALILDADPESWAEITTETARVLDQAMRNVIREGELTAAQRLTPSFIGFGLSDNETLIVNTLVQGLLRPNTFFNAERTEAARQEAAQRVEPVSRTVAAGETILRTGDRIESLDIEALDKLGLLRIERSWRDYLAALILGGLLSGILMAYITQRRPLFWLDQLRAFLLAGILVAFILLAKPLIAMPGVIPYLYPLAAMSMLIGALIGLPMSLISTTLVGVLILILTGGNAGLMVYLLTSAIAGALALGQAERLNAFVRAGFWIIVAGLVSLAVFHLSVLDGARNQNIVPLVAASVINGVFSSSFALVLFYLLGQVFGITTSLQLLELSRPTHPLLRQLLLKAPGTYHHTLLVGNLAEEAASAIGADVLLTRVGSYYHDIGKTVRPYFFIENNTDDLNPHDRLDPYTSARIIINHVSDGVALARKHRLPEAIIDFIREHHGTTRVEYFYHQACQEHESPEGVDQRAFRYQGPTPRSRETAILMLADSCEATVRAVNPPTQEEMIDLIRSVINRRLMSGQLDDSQLTLRDLSQIAIAFARMLQGIHHPRVNYPSNESPRGDRTLSARAALPAA
ncbi:MAG: HDIG domain-containing protein [Caldilineales bacterium]|nr:HDIG domain-containing protein [Caldilineales bacterium]